MSLKTVAFLSSDSGFGSVHVIKLMPLRRKTLTTNRITDVYRYAVTGAKRFQGFCRPKKSPGNNVMCYATSQKNITAETASRPMDIFVFRFRKRRGTRSCGLKPNGTNHSDNIGFGPATFRSPTYGRSADAGYASRYVVAAVSTILYARS